MAQFSLWPATRNHPVWRSLSLQARSLFIDMCVLTADGERTEYPDGFFLEDWLSFCDYLKINVRKAIEELESKQLLQRFDDPKGWIINGWTDRARVLRPTSAEGVSMPLGQKQASHYAKQRSKASNSTASAAELNAKHERPWIDTSFDYGDVDPFSE